MVKSDLKADQKKYGRTYTDRYVVNIILDMVGYSDGFIVGKHVIDNSCGDGAFLSEVVSRYCESAFHQGFSIDRLRNDLSFFIHGIDINPESCNLCRRNLCTIAEKYGIYHVDFDIHCSNALIDNSYDGKMDFVVGNPPYVRVHNLVESAKNMKHLSFTQRGMTDLYIAFFEVGLRMLNSNGRLGYITPSSYFNSLAGRYMRKYFVENRLLRKILDFKHSKVFYRVSTYTAISILTKGNNLDEIEYFEFDENSKSKVKISELSSHQYFVSGNFYFSTEENLAILRRVFFNYGVCDVQVKNGYATLMDDVFVGDFNLKSEFIRPVVKASKGLFTEIIYPYDRYANLISERSLKQDRQLYSYLLERKDYLNRRSIRENDNFEWYAFGRRQGLKDTYKNKIALNPLIRTKFDLKLTFAPSGVGVYSGLYILCGNVNVEKIKKVLVSDEFEFYVSLLGKYKSGGYYSFSSKDVKAFLNYKLAYDKGVDYEK